MLIIIVRPKIIDSTHDTSPPKQNYIKNYKKTTKKLQPSKMVSFFGLKLGSDRKKAQYVHTPHHSINMGLY